MNDSSPQRHGAPRAAAPGKPLDRVPGGRLVAFFIGIVAFLYLIRSILLPFVLAGILAFICMPLVEGLKRRLRLPRWLSALVVLTALAAIATVGGWLGIPPLLDQITHTAGDLGGAVESFARTLMGNRSIDILGTSVNASNIGDYTVSSLRGWLGQGTRLLTVATLGFAWIFGMLLTVVVLGYFLFDAYRIEAGLFWLVPPRYRPFAHRAWAELAPVLRRYFIGVALVVIYASIAAYIGLGLALGLHHAVVLAVMTGVLEVIPLVGPAASAVIAGLVAVGEATGAGAIMAYIFYATGLRISIDEFFGPIVLGRAGRIPPVLIIFCFLAGGFLFGIVGVVLAVPVALSIRIILQVLYDESDWRDVPVNTENG